MSWTVTTLAWGMLEFPDAYDSVGEYDQMLDTIKWCVSFVEVLDGGGIDSSIACFDLTAHPILQLHHTTSNVHNNRPLDWLIKAHYKPDALVYQVGSWKDHSYWGPPELFPSDMERPSLYVAPVSGGR